MTRRYDRAMRYPRGITDDEIRQIVSARKDDTERQYFRLSGEARRIIEAEAEHYGLDKTKALELLLREHRERVQGKR